MHPRFFERPKRCRPVVGDKEKEGSKMKREKAKAKFMRGAEEMFEEM